MVLGLYTMPCHALLSLEKIMDNALYPSLKQTEMIHGPVKSQKAALHPSGSHTTFVLIFDENSCLISFVPGITEKREKTENINQTNNRETSNPNIVPHAKIPVLLASAGVGLLVLVATHLYISLFLVVHRQSHELLASGELWVVSGFIPTSV